MNPVLLASCREVQEIAKWVTDIEKSDWSSVAIFTLAIIKNSELIEI